jgi:hypothetical protein
VARFVCHACAQELDLEDPIGRSMQCPRCSSDLRCCRNCRFYDEAVYNECAEPMAERVLEKSRANFCDYFARRPDAQPSKAAPGPDRLSDLDKLFRK